jgi:diguanylate cyclase (GGDEF)-like protein
MAKIGPKKEEDLGNLKSEYDNLYLKNQSLKEENSLLDGKVTQTLGLYNISKDMSKELDENKIFHIFKERINDYVKIGCCNFLVKGADLKRYEGYINFPLVINNEIAGHLIARDIAENDKYRFQILAQQFLIMVKRAFLYKNIQELAIMDGLTQVFSRRHFLERFKEELRRSRKFKHNFSFLMLDIDKFKNFNDKYGHLVGDAVLREASKTVKENVRQIDFVGRYGGEELSIILPETDKEQALLAAERIRQAIEKREIKVYDEELKVTVSVGISTFPDDADDSSLLIEAADKALYLAKNEGRNRVCAYRRK